MLDPIARAEIEWGNHPVTWPVPCRTAPTWWRFRRRKHEAAMADIFGPISDDARDAFWREIRKGQSVYEDCGGYLLRCYRAMLGEPVEEPYTYHQATDALLAERSKQP